MPQRFKRVSPQLSKAVLDDFGNKRAKALFETGSINLSHWRKFGAPYLYMLLLFYRNPSLLAWKENGINSENDLYLNITNP